MITEENQAVPGLASHYSVSQVAKMWGLSDDSIIRIFEKEPDVLVIGNKPKGSRRYKRTLRIPAFVIERVHKRLSLG
jgi:hypothetical protein